MAEVIKGEVLPQGKPVFDPKKPYEWKPEDKFVLDGLEFARLYQTLNYEMNFGGLSTQSKIDLFNMVLEVLKVAVESGVATEVVLKDSSIGADLASPPSGAIITPPPPSEN